MTGAQTIMMFVLCVLAAFLGMAAGKGIYLAQRALRIRRWAKQDARRAKARS